MSVQIRLATILSVFLFFIVVQGEAQNIHFEIQSNVPNFALKILTTKDVTPDKGTTSAAFSSGATKMTTFIETIASSRDGVISTQLPASYFEKQFRDSIFLTAPGFTPIRAPKFNTKKAYQANFSPYPAQNALYELVRNGIQPCIEEYIPKHSYTKECILRDTLTQWPLERLELGEVPGDVVYRHSYQPVFENIYSNEEAKAQYSMNGDGVAWGIICGITIIGYMRETILPLIRAMWDTEPYLSAFSWTTNEYGDMGPNREFTKYFKCLRNGELHYADDLKSTDCRKIQPPQIHERWQWQLAPPAPKYQTDPYSSVIDSIRAAVESDSNEHPVAQHIDLTAFLKRLETYSIWSSMSLSELQQACWTDLEELGVDREFWTKLDELLYHDIVRHKIKAPKNQPTEVNWDQFSCLESGVGIPPLADVFKHYYADLAYEIVHDNLDRFLSTTDSIPQLLAVIDEYQNARKSSYYSQRSSNQIRIKLRLDSTNASAFWRALEGRLNHGNWSFQQTYRGLDVELTLEDPSFREIFRNVYYFEHRELSALLNKHYKSSRPDFMCGELAKTLLEKYNIKEDALRQFSCIDVSQLPEITFSKPYSVRVSQSNHTITVADTVLFRLTEARQHFAEAFVDNSMSDNARYLNSSDLFPIANKEAPHSARLLALQGDGVADIIPGDYSISASFFTQGDTVHLSLIRALSNPSTSNVLDIDAAEWNQSLSKGRINMSITNTLSDFLIFSGVSNAHLTTLTKGGVVEPLLMDEARRIQTSSIWNSLSDKATEDKDFIQSYGTLRDYICNLIVLTEDLTLNQHLLRELYGHDPVTMVPVTTMDSLKSTVISLSRRINEHADSYASRNADLKRAQEQQREEDSKKRQAASAELERSFSRWKSLNQFYANPDGYYSCESVSGTLKIEHNRWQFEGLSQFYTTEYASGTFEKNTNSRGELGTLRVLDGGYDVGWGGSLNLELDDKDYPNGRNGWVLYVDFDGHPIVSRSICYKQ